MGFRQMIEQNSNDRADAMARNWFVLLTSEESTDTDIAAFEEWCNADPAHEKAYGKISQVGNELSLLAHTHQGENLLQFAEESLNQQPLWRKLKEQVKGYVRLPYGVPISAAVCMIMLVLYVQVPVPLGDIHQTQVSEIQDVVLADGSVITLGAQSLVEVAYTESMRTVHLRKGQAFFDVAKNPERPFIIKLDDAEISVLGTKFDVHLDSEQATVAVMEGRVSVTPKRIEQPQASKGIMTAILVAGQEVSVSTVGFTNKVRSAQTMPGEWREGRMVYAEAPLGRIIRDINRYYDTPIVLGHQSLHAILMTTSFDTNQVDAFLRNLPDMLPVKVVRDVSGTITIKPVKAKVGLSFKSQQS